jgi:hypothetical protein
MKIARVFPRRTRATPDDDMAFVGPPTMLFPPECDSVDVSVAFTWDKPYAEYLADLWGKVAPTRIGGPAYGLPGGEFEPGKYLKNGYVITSRGCTNKCWFCSVWKRETGIKELEIKDGWNVLDDNILACSDDHIVSVFNMLWKYRGRVEFTGGLEARLLKSWHVDLLARIKTKQMFFAYDTPDDLDPLVVASKMLVEAGFTRSSMRCYVLIGYPKDTMDEAVGRLEKTLCLGFYPMAMLYRPEKGYPQVGWKKLQRSWARPAIICASHNPNIPSRKKPRSPRKP